MITMLIYLFISGLRIKQVGGNLINGSFSSRLERLSQSARTGKAGAVIDKLAMNEN